MKSLQTTSERRLPIVYARIHQSLHQQHQQKLRRPWRSCDKETLLTKRSPLWYKSTTGRKRHIQGDVLREGRLWMAWIQDFRWFQVSKRRSGALHARGRRMLSVQLQSCSCLRQRDIPSSGLAAGTAPLRLPSPAPAAAASVRSFTEHMKLLGGDYPSTALQPFVIFLGNS